MTKRWTRDQAVIIRKLASIAELAIAVARIKAPKSSADWDGDLEFVGIIRREADVAMRRDLRRAA